MRYKIAAILTIFAIAFPDVALADARQDALANISRCTVISDDRGFLDCIDGAARQLRAQLGSPAAPVPQFGIAAPPVTTLPARQSAVTSNAAALPATRKGSWLGRVLGGAPSKSALPMAFYTFDKHGVFTVSLANGEVWRQRDNDSNHAHWQAPASNYRVTIKEGVFGASILDVNGDPTHYLVQRLR